MRCNGLATLASERDDRADFIHLARVLSRPIVRRADVPPVGAIDSVDLLAKSEQGAGHQLAIRRGFGHFW